MSDGKAKTSRNQPAHEIRIGTIKAVIWANQVSNNGTMHNVVLARIYRDDAGQWHETQSLGRDDCLVAERVLSMAFSWILEAERK